MSLLKVVITGGATVMGLSWYSAMPQDAPPPPSPPAGPVVEVNDTPVRSGRAGEIGVESASIRVRGSGPRGEQQRGPGQFSPVAREIINLREVHDELALSDDVRQKAAEIQGELERSARRIMEQSWRRSPNDTPDQVWARMSAMFSEMNRATEEAEGEFLKLLDERQAARFRQLLVQNDGFRALGRRDVAKLLKLSDDQRKSLTTIIEDAQVPFAGDPAEFAQKALKVLNQEQRESFARMQGPQFQFPPLGMSTAGRPAEGGMGPFGGPEGGFRGGFGGPGGPGGPMGQERKLVAKFDQDDNGWLNSEERKAARESLRDSGGGMGRRGGFGPPGGFGGRESMTPTPGARVSVADVKPSDAPLYDAKTVRTIFLEFESDDWESEMADFYKSDVEVPAKMIVDGREYPNVGVGFRGMSSFMGVPAGGKRSLNISMDMADGKQKLMGYKTLNLLNAHEDPSFLHTVLYFDLARQHLPAPKANFARVVINGESWGLYVNAQQFNKEFVSENYKTGKGARWKVPGSPNGRGGLEYLGENSEAYKRIYTIKSDDNDESWKALIRLCKTLNETPTDELEKALEPMLDLDEVLWFLALDCALVNNDGYWTRASDYSIYLDPKGKFHILPHDANETLSGGMGGPPGMGGGRGGPGGGFGPNGGPEGRGPENRPREQPRDGDLRDLPPGGDRGPGSDQAGPNGPGRDVAGPGFGPPGFGGPGGGGGMRPFGGPGGPGGGSVSLDPLIGLNDASKPLRSRLLSVPALRERYLQNVREIAQKHLDWKTLGPIVSEYVALIEPEVEADTKKLSTVAAFRQAVADETAAGDAGRGRRMSLRQFVDQRREFLLKHEAIRELGP